MSLFFLFEPLLHITVALQKTEILCPGIVRVCPKVHFVGVTSGAKNKREEVDALVVPTD